MKNCDHNIHFIKIRCRYVVDSVEKQEARNIYFLSPIMEYTVVVNRKEYISSLPGLSIHRKCSVLLSRILKKGLSI
jgi:hypothetical protein